MTNPVGDDKLSTRRPDAGQPSVDTSSSPNQPPAKATRRPSTDSIIEPELSRTGQRLADAPPMGASPLGHAAAVRSALDFAQRSIAAQPDIALASFSGLATARVEALLNDPIT